MGFSFHWAFHKWPSTVNKMFNKQIRRNMEVYGDDMLIKSKERMERKKESGKKRRENVVVIGVLRAICGKPNGKKSPMMRATRN